MAAIKGSRIAYLYRILSEASSTAGTAIAFTTENSRKKSRDADTVSTKSGTIRVPGDTEVEISTTALFSSENDPLIGKLETALDNSAIVEVWEVNLDIKGTLLNADKFKAKYFRAYMTNLELSSNSEDHAEYSLDFSVIGTGADGFATVSSDQQKIAEYVFKDTSSGTV
ncbi:phage major tail protein, TP901-1 family [Lactococcus cremoris]|uniref:phage major tail protein, TP901-1 family n=1 Tax=Lactococcus lactis subsp. cremoris TaxID=1359 RepID=UPI001064759F|nr:phage major tail protein, TP901-1 family [Lactococcus cremoris]TEA99101.1 phage major tail protein, TP901-1 family [Lactococcus cremoris]